MAFEATSHLDRIADLLIVLVPLGGYLLHQLGQIKTAVGITKQVTNEHLPHMYGRLRVHDEALKLTTPEHPPITFFPNGDRPH